MVLIVMPYGIGRAHGRRAAPWRGGAEVGQSCCPVRPRLPKPHAGRRNLLIATLRLALLRRTAAQTVVLLLSSVLFAGTVLAQTPPPATHESAQVAEAFAELDALSATIAGRLRDLAQHTGLPTPPPAGPVLLTGSSGTTGVPPSPPSETGDVGGTGIQVAGPRVEPEPCGTREDMALSMDEMDERYAEFKQVILGVNGGLRTYRSDMRDVDKACAPQTKSSITSALRRLQKLDIDADVELAVGLSNCVDRLRRSTDEAFNKDGISTIRLQRLSDELQRLTKATHRAQDMERALRRADSKRNRLKEELGQLEHEIDNDCNSTRTQ